MDSSKQDQKITQQPETGSGIHNLVDGVKDKFSAHKATPGIALPPSDVNIKEEGTKEERLAKAQALNK